MNFDFQYAVLCNMFYQLPKKKKKCLVSKNATSKSFYLNIIKCYKCKCCQTLQTTGYCTLTKIPLLNNVRVENL